MTYPESLSPEHPLPLVPYPVKVERGAGHFTLTSQSLVIAATGHPAEAKAAARFIARLKESSGLTLEYREASAAPDPERGSIRFELETPPKLRPEAYTLHVTPGHIRILATDEAGLFYAHTTLWQLLGAATEPGLPTTLPELLIEDHPRFAWRGFMLDSSRHLQSIEQIKRLIDQAALHKLNTLHWHLTDDQGWRLEIKQYPKLTEVGAWRIPAGKAGRGPDGQPLHYGGFYTQDEVREIVAYAAEQHVTIVPEIEVPGHARAAIAAYPEFGSTGEETTVAPEWGIHPFLFNVDDATFTFLENVLREVIALFPSSYIHIGGDEAIKHHWKRSPSAQAKIRELGLADENALQSWFIRRIAQFLTANNRKLIGWDEILEGGPLPEGANVMVWHTIENAAIAARAGHDVVMCPTNYAYLNRVQSLAHDEPPGHDRMIPLRKLYEFEPVPADLDEKTARHVIGYQANLWTEYVRTAEQVEHMLYPRLCAAAENAWSPASQRDWQGFLPRIAVHLRRIIRAGLRPADSAFAVKIEALPAADATGDAIYTPTQFRLSNQADFGELRYTLDGSEPRSDSALYTGPVQLPELPVTLTASAFFDGQALAKSRCAIINADSLRTRNAEQLVPDLETCALRLEDDEPLEGERLALPVIIQDPIWIWKDAVLDGIRSLEVSVVDLPYNFAFANESVGIPPDAPKEPVYLQLYLDHFEGEPIAQTLVDPHHATAIQTLKLKLPEGNGGPPRDLLFKFTGSEFTATARETLWAIYRVRLGS